VPVSHFRFCSSILRELRARGVRLAIDDFGAGFSNLKYITDLRPDVVKIDRQLIEGLSDGSREQVLISSLTALCHAQGAAIIAEGVETVAELHALRRAGVRFAQGYVFARPDATPAIRDFSAILGDSAAPRDPALARGSSVSRSSEVPRSRRHSR
jgi:EAL domain-containing protein (putative c-di-GMP-specific phosphodiesterase class I)